MAGRIIRLVCIFFMSLWLTSKVMAFTPLLAIPLIGATVLFMINEIKEIKDENKKTKKRKKRNQAVTRTTKS